jgi:hypothetical protein
VGRKLPQPPPAAPLAQLRKHDPELWKLVYATAEGQVSAGPTQQALAAALMGAPDIARFILAAPIAAWTAEWPVLPRTDVVTITLTREQAEALGSSFGSAERGREDFDYLASLDNGDYEPSDVEEHDRWAAREVEVEAIVAKQIKEQTRG